MLDLIMFLLTGKVKFLESSSIKGKEWLAFSYKGKGYEMTIRKNDVYDTE